MVKTLLASAVEAVTNAIDRHMHHLVEDNRTRAGGLRLYEVGYTAKALENTDVYRWMYETKTPIQRRVGEIRVSFFTEKDEAKFFRDLLNRHIKANPPIHISYGPDHKRVRGTVV